MDTFILSTIITLLIGVIGYLLKRFVTSVDKLNETVNKLNISVTAMNGVILSNKNEFDLFANSCSSQKEVVDRRLNKHGERLDEHDRDIAILKEKTK